MVKIRLKEGVYTNVIAILIAGAGALTAATATQIALQVVGYLALFVGGTLLLWGVTIDGEHWWKRRLRLHLPRIFRGQMYIGQILTFDSQLDDRNTLSLTVRGYNGPCEICCFLRHQGM